ncbi:hypothetical protein [Microbacterium oleivorans]|uniref:Uncharacterized protein n=1 Tax=Microbacterium oleivorans TaxID=273677 RepID=A0A7D5IRY3_9MICO|nr:hypothetical protein [Microbacterium oleivorans]QLD10874.1 hypothetical protein HW566_03200 [Microbacterium oleivorans]
MTYTQTHILLSEAWPDGITPDASDGISNFIPANGWTCETTDFLTFEGRYIGVDTGTAETPIAPPTSMEWALIPQIGIAHTTSYQRSRPAWRDVTPADLGITVIGASIVTTGTPRVVVTTSPTQTTIFQIRVPVAALGRFRFLNQITYTGTKPSLKTSLIMIEKGQTL